MIGYHHAIIGQGNGHSVGEAVNSFVVNLHEVAGVKACCLACPAHDSNYVIGMQEDFLSCSIANRLGEMAQWIII